MSEPMYTKAALERVVGEVVAKVLEAARVGKLVPGLEFTVAIHPEEMLPDGDAEKVVRVKFPAAEVKV